MTLDLKRKLSGYAAAAIGVAAVTVAYTLLVPAVNSTTVALSYLLVVLLVASARGLGPSILASIAGMMCFNFFFFPPVRTFTIEDPQNWVALLAFLVTAVVASKLSSAARTRAEEAERRREEVWRLYQLSRAIIASPDNEAATSSLTREVLETFSLEYCGVFLPGEGSRWQAAAESGSFSGTDPDKRNSEIAVAFQSGDSRVIPGRAEKGDQGLVAYVPLKIGIKATGVAVLKAPRHIDIGTVDAIGGLIALALERARFLKEVGQTYALRQSDELKSALLASVSHDLRTPLTSIRTAIESILGSRQALNASALDELHQIIGEEVERLTRLVDNLLEMARIEGGEIKVSKEWVPLSEILANVLHRCAGLTKNHIVRIEHDDDKTLIKVDSRLIAEALANLIENAAKYSPADSEIEVKAAFAVSSLSVSVADRGPGVKEDEAGRVFEKFYRGSELTSGRKPGTGMGLAIVKGLIEAHGGSVWVRPNDGAGAVFGFSIPVEIKKTDGAEPGSSQDPAEPPDGGGPSDRIVNAREYR